MNLMAAAAFVIAAYLIGSLSFAVIVSRALSLPDPRSYGSGNPGATNVLRTGRKLAALLTLLGDGGKGWLAVFLAARYAPDYGVDAAGVAGCAIAVFVGHIFPVFFRFTGGKGVATAGGILLAINPWLGAATLATWVIIAFFFRYSSLAAVAAAALGMLAVMRLWVRSRVAELAVRRALGAGRGRVLGFIAARAAGVTAGGVLIAWWLAPIVSEAAARVMSGLPAWDAGAAVAPIVVLAGATAAGVLGPAWRMATAPPGDALGHAGP